jgi:hypothetical protein
MLITLDQVYCLGIIGHFVHCHCFFNPLGPLTIQGPYNLPLSLSNIILRSFEANL